MLKKSLTIAALLTTLSGPLLADSRMDLAKQYAELPANQQMMTEMFSPKSMGSQFASMLPPTLQVNDDQVQRVGALMSEVMVSIRPQMEELMVTKSAEAFSEDELKAMIEFYSSEVGASILLKTQPYFQSVMAEMNPLIMQRMGAIGPQIDAILSE